MTTYDPDRKRDEMTYTIDQRGTLEMKLCRAKAAAQYGRTKAEREKAAQVVVATEAKLSQLA